MNINYILMWIGFIIALCLYFPLLKGIYNNEIQQSFATWSLWVALDAIALGSIVMQKGNFIFLMLYVLGGTTTAVLLVVKKQFKWTRFESFILFLVILCLIAWSVSGPRMATIMSSIAVAISSIPQFRDSWKNPDKMTGIVYMGYILANGLFMFAGKSWTIEERFYPGSCVILCSAITIAALKKKPAQSS